MTTEGDHGSLDDANDCTIIPLHRLRFERQSSDESTAVYRAVVDDRDAPGAPIYTVTVTLAAPRDADDTADLEAFLGEMEAGFLLTAPITDEPEDEQAGDEFDPKTDILVELDLADLRTLEGRFGVVAFVRTAVGQAVPAARSYAGSQTRSLEATLSRGERQGYASQRGVLRWAFVHAKRGSGFLQRVHVLQGATQKVRAKKVYVKGENPPFRYTICAGWDPQR